MGRMGWAHGRLDEIVAPRGDKISPLEAATLPFIGMDHVESHTMRIIAKRAASDVRSTCTRFEPSDVIYGRLRPYLNKVVVPHFDGIASAEFIVLPTLGATIPKFLAYRLNARDFVKFANSLNEGDRPRVSFEQIGAFEIDLPSIPEQRAIVEKIETLFSELEQGKAQLEAVRAQLKRYRQSVLKAAFEGKLTADWREQQQKAGNMPTAAELLEHIKAERTACYEQRLTDWKQAVEDWEVQGGKTSSQKKPRKPTKPKDLPPLSQDELAELQILPHQWMWHRLGLATLGVEYGSAKKSVSEGEVAVIRMGNMQNGVIDWDDLVYTNDPKEIKQYKLHVGDVLFNRTNSPELVGKTVIYRGERPAVFAGYLVRVNQIASIAQAQFVTYFLNSHQAKQHGNRVKTDGVNQSNINGTKLVSYPFPFCSLAEQNEIVAVLDSRFSVLDQLEQNIDEAMEQAEALRQSILKKAFEGQLLSASELVAVRADPAYEPAEKLLARIRTEREHTEGVKPARSRKRKAGQPTRTIKLPKGERYRQAAYAAYAVNRLSHLSTFGRVQQMKFLYLVPHLIERESHIHAQREAAGPLDPAIHSIESLARKQNWFSVRKSGKRYIYQPGNRITTAITTAERSFGEHKAKVDWLLDQFVKFDTERAELLATTFAVWNDHLIDGHEPSEDEIVRGVHGWHPDKAAKFDAARIGRCIKWIHDNDMVPTGLGPKTQPVRGAE